MGEDSGQTPGFQGCSVALLIKQVVNCNKAWQCAVCWGSWSFGRSSQESSDLVNTAEDSPPQSPVPRRLHGKWVLSLE